MKSDCRLVALLPEQEAIGAFPSRPAARFLVILLDAFRQREVNYFADAGLVDAEPEGDRADDYATSSATTIADFFAARRFHFSVVSDASILFSLRNS